MNNIITAGDRRGARRRGCSPEDYVWHRSQGQKWCPRCNRWCPIEAFSADVSRGDRMNNRCRSCNAVGRRGQRDPLNRWAREVSAEAGGRVDESGRGDPAADRRTGVETADEPETTYHRQLAAVAITPMKPQAEDRRQERPARERER